MHEIKSLFVLLFSQFWLLFGDTVIDLISSLCASVKTAANTCNYLSSLACDSPTNKIACVQCPK